MPAAFGAALLIASACASPTSQSPATGSASAPPTAATATAAVIAAASSSAPLPLSEQPNRAAYDEYFSDMWLGSMPVGKVIGTDGFPTRTTVFRAGADQMCLMTQVRKSIPAGMVASVVYDPVAKADAQQRVTIPSAWPVGGAGGCGTLPGSAGRYEYKLYVSGVVVAVLPFEVR